MASAVHPPRPSHSHHSSHSFSRPSGDVASFNSTYQSSYPPTSSYSNPYVHAPQQDGMTHPGSSFRGSFNGTDNRRPQPSTAEPQIYTAVYSGVMVYEMELQGVAIMRRRADSWLNATQILKVASIEKGRRTKILEKEILTGHHEKVQGGYGRYQGTWISYERGREFCRQYGVEDLLRPLLDYDLGSDGTGNTAFADTPTKEQAQAANRKKMYNSSIDSRINGTGPNSTFFQNISPTASTAIAAMHKAAHYNSPMQRPPSAQRRPSGLMHRQSSSQQMHSQDSAYHPASQQSFTSDHAPFDTNQDTMYAALSSQLQHPDSQEPPRKKMRTSFAGPDPYLDPVLQDETPTEPSESFSQSQNPQHFPHDSEQGLLSLPPLPTPEGKSGEDKRLMLLDLFAEPSRTDFFSHQAVINLSGQELDIPLDAKGNTALHWAGMLGKISVIKTLVTKGANLFRGNAGGETALMHAVQVNNTHQANNFVEMLEYLGPLIELRDAAGRTVLHHIAVASGIKGRTQSSRYYLESLLAFTVRQGGGPNSQGNSFTDKAQPSQNHPSNKSKPLNLARFMSEIVNIQDKCGNTALNLVSRIGSHSIINQLEEVGADFTIGNHKGFRPESFGIFPKSHNTQTSQNQTSQGNGKSQASSGAEMKSTSQIDQIREEIFATTQSILTHTTTSYTTELAHLTDTLTAQSQQMRDLEAERTTLQQRLAEHKAAATERRTRATRRDNLTQVLQSLRAKQKQNGGEKRKREDLLLPSPNASSQIQNSASTTKLTALLSAHTQLNSTLSTQIASLTRLSASEASEEREANLRRVISLCTGTAEGEVDGVLDGLMGAVGA